MKIEVAALSPTAEPLVVGTYEPTNDVPLVDELIAAGVAASWRR